MALRRLLLRAGPVAARRRPRALGLSTAIAEMASVEALSSA